MRVLSSYSSYTTLAGNRKRREINLIGHLYDNTKNEKVDVMQRNGGGGGRKKQTLMWVNTQKTNKSSPMCLDRRTVLRQPLLEVVGQEVSKLLD